MQFILFVMIILTVSMWIACVTFILFSWKMTIRQNKMFSYILMRLDRLGSLKTDDSFKEKSQEISLSIAKDEPLSKYQDVTLPDDIDISFIERKQ